MNWDELETTPCTQCGTDSWTQFYEYTPEKDEPTDVETAHFECDDCGKHARVFEENGSIQRSGGMRT